MPPQQIKLFEQETDEQSVATLLDSTEGWLAQLILSHRELQKQFKIMSEKLDRVIESNVTRASLQELREEFHSFRDKTDKMLTEKWKLVFAG